MGKRVNGWIGVIDALNHDLQDEGKTIYEEYYNNIGDAIESKLKLVVDFALRGADKSHYTTGGFKFYDPHYLDQLICRDYQYHEGQAHVHPDIGHLQMCKTGFHFCSTVEGCSYYYPFIAAPVTPVLGRIVHSESMPGYYAKYCAGELYVGRRLSDIFKCLQSIAEMVYNIGTYHYNYPDYFVALTARCGLLADQLGIRPEYRDECPKIIAALDEKAILVLCVEEYWREYWMLHRTQVGAHMPTSVELTVKYITALCEEVYNKHCKEEFEAFIKEENENEK